jgi:hypothetical protein
VLDAVYDHGERSIGRAVFAAKCSLIARYPTQDTLYGPAVLYTLFGDPALRLKHLPPTGVEEPGQPAGDSLPPSATVLRGASGVGRDASSVMYDAMGRRVTNPGSGVYFVRTGCKPPDRVVILH